jgi:hypothetical protein
MRARMEDPQQPVVRAPRSEEARQGHLPAVWRQRREGAPRVDAREASGRGSRRAAALARHPSALGSGSYRPGRRRRRRMRAGQLSAAVPPVPRACHARLARAAVIAKRRGGAHRRGRPARPAPRGRRTRAGP